MALGLNPTQAGVPRVHRCPTMATMAHPAPLVVSLLLDWEAQAYFDELRRRHFPAERNTTAAHVTLFHALPAGRVNDVDRSTADAARRPAFAVRVCGVRLLGHGVAYDLQDAGTKDARSGDDTRPGDARPDHVRPGDAPLDAVHARLRTQWLSHLTRQDAQPLRAHVTVQNKVTPATARALHAELAADFVPYDVLATGLALWRYRGGPWEPVSRHLFHEREALR